VIDAQALNAVRCSMSPDRIRHRGNHVSKCPAAAILVRAVHFRLSAATIDSCDVGVEVAENASDTLLERNHFTKNRVGIRFAASVITPPLPTMSQGRQGCRVVGRAQRFGFAR